MVQVINDVRSFLIDDFVLNGAEQLLMLLNTSADQFVKAEESYNLTNYILTDCEGVHVESGIDNSVSCCLAVVYYYLIFSILICIFCAVECLSII